MNKIEKLLNELCPNGVEFKNLWEIGELSNTGVDKKIRENQKEVFLLNFLDVMNNHYINKNIPSMKVTASEAEIQKCNILKNDLFITPSSENINEIGFASVAIEDMPNVCYSYHIMRFRIFNRQINPYFLRYCFDSENLRKQILKNAQGITRFGLTQPKWKNLQIPIPPLEIQEEIVKILDTFTELEARRRQYEYYRNKLLSFEYLKTNGGGYELKMLGEIGKFTRGNGLQKKDLLDSGIPCIHYGQIHTYYENYTHTTKSFVSAENAKKLKKAKKGDLVIAGASENIEDVCKAVVYLGESDVCISGDSFAFSHSLNPKYVGYVFQGEQFIEYKKKYAQGTKVMRLSIERLKQFQIPIPSLETQEKIVSILDKFHALTTDLQSGIPAEIEARKKQYEYYRNQLLTFKEAI